MFSHSSGAGSCPPSRIARSTACCCDSSTAAACRFCEPLKTWKPTGATPSAAIRCGSAGTCAASMPNGFGPPPIFMPDDFSSNAGLIRIASRGATPSEAAAASARSYCDADSRLIVIPAATACRISAGVLPGPAKLIPVGATPASSATRISAADATSMPSASRARHWTTAGIGLAFIA